VTARLERTTFTTSRLLDFFSEKELTAQTGHGPVQWPLVILKELLDNALDACEEAGTAPEISVTVDGEGITITDNGPGIPPETVAGVLDYSVRVSSREAYAAPDRGAQGNALKTLVAMPFVLDAGVVVPGLSTHRTGRSEGHVTVTARETRHEITVRVDPIRQVPVIDHDPHPADVRTGTRVTVLWPDSARSILDEARSEFLQIAQDFAWLNPHLRLTVDWGGPGHNPETDRRLALEPTTAAWAKWGPSDPTSPHWYTPQMLERLVAAYVSDPAHAGMSVREFVTQFRGLTSSAKGKQVLAETRMTRTALADLANGALDSAAIAGLLDAMRRHSRPVKPAQLGVIGREHLAARLAGLGAEMESFAYKKTEGEDGGQPYVVEIAFAWRPDLGRSRLVTGVNWSPGLVNPFRQLGKFGESLDRVLERQRADEDCVLALHVARPVVTYADRGKSAVVL
jgi:DNA topoisomerase VI subunit B